MALVTKKFESDLKSVMEGFDPIDLMTVEQLLDLEESFEARLAAVRSRIDAKKKPKGEYDFDDEKPKSPVTKVSGTYGKSFTDMDDEGQAKATVKAADAPKRGRGRPRKTV